MKKNIFIFLPQITQILAFPSAPDFQFTDSSLSFSCSEANNKNPCQSVCPKIYIHMIISPHGSTLIPRILPLLTSCSEARNKNPCQSVSIRVQKNIYPCAKKNIYPCDYIPTRIPRVLPYLSVVAKLTIKSVQSVGYNLQKSHLFVNVCRINTDKSSSLYR